MFRTLMATRTTPLSADHVDALNALDIEFFDKKFRAVRSGWRAYLDHLNNGPASNAPVEVMQAWGNKKDDLFAAMLTEIAKALDYDFDETYVECTVLAGRER